MRSTRVLFGVGSLLLATAVPATLLGGCTRPAMGTSTSAMAQPAPRARTTVGATSYTPVTDQRLVSPEAENWLMYRRTYDGWGYSPLDQITAGNVKELVPVWTFSTGVVEGHQAPPIVNNGVMFVSTPQNQVLAFEAKSGELLWRYKRELPEDLFQLHPTNRGVGLYEDKVYLATLDAHVVALQKLMRSAAANLDFEKAATLRCTRVPDGHAAHCYGPLSAPASSSARLATLPPRPVIPVRSVLRPEIGSSSQAESESDRSSPLVICWRASLLSRSIPLTPPAVSSATARA